MFSYFIPISLLVLAGFALGLAVGWLTWMSSKEPTGREQGDQEETDDAAGLEPAPLTPNLATDWSVMPDHVPDWSTSDLPVWRAREISSSGRLEAEMSSADRVG